MAFDDQNDFDFDEKVSANTVKEKTKLPLGPVKKRGPKKAVLLQEPVVPLDEAYIPPILPTLDEGNDICEDRVEDIPPCQALPVNVNITNETPCNVKEMTLVPSHETKPIPLEFDKYRCSWITRKSTGKKPARLSKNYIEWPTSTTTHCWWCCHPFDTVPVPLTVNYNDSIDAFSVKGTFCSWGCAKAYSLGESHTLGYQSQLLLLLRKRVEGKVVPIKCAPQRSQLNIFGGPINIQAFRNASATECKQSMLTVNMLAQTFGLMMIKNDHHDQEHTQEPMSIMGGRDRGLKSDLGLDSISIKKNEPLKLKRSKPSPATKGKTVLERVLGITS